MKLFFSDGEKVASVGIPTKFESSPLHSSSPFPYFNRMQIFKLCSHEMLASTFLPNQRKVLVSINKQSLDNPLPSCQIHLSHGKLSQVVLTELCWKESPQSGHAILKHSHSAEDTAIGLLICMARSLFSIPGVR